MVSMTSLIDKNNTKKVKKDNDGKILFQDLLFSVRFRIKKHYEFIEKDKRIIQENIDSEGVIEDTLKRIKERKLKIQELEEFIDYSF